MALWLDLAERIGRSDTVSVLSLDLNRSWVGVLSQKPSTGIENTSCWRMMRSHVEWDPFVLTETILNHLSPVLQIWEFGRYQQSYLLNPMRITNSVKIPARTRKFYQLICRPMSNSTFFFLVTLGHSAMWYIDPASVLATELSL